MSLISVSKIDGNQLSTSFECIRMDNFFRGFFFFFFLIPIKGAQYNNIQK